MSAGGGARSSSSAWSSSPECSSTATSRSRRRHATGTARCSSPISSSTCPVASGSSSTPRRRWRPTSMRSRQRTSLPGRPTSSSTPARCVTTSAGSAAKRYWQQFESTPEFVIMFLPDETFFRAACEADSGLLELGPESGVLPSSPTSLIGLLKVFAYAWQQETIAQDARDIAALGRELYERLGVFASHFSKVGRALGTAVGAYNERDRLARTSAARHCPEVRGARRGFGRARGGRAAREGARAAHGRGTDPRGAHSARGRRGLANGITDRRATFT